MYQVLFDKRFCSVGAFFCNHFKIFFLKIIIGIEEVFDLFFETGTLDETADRNNNGIIDSIDDTLSLIEELVKKGYDPETDIRYLELPDGKHDVATWARAFPEFLKWNSI
jgi:hypothetical protein